MVQKPNSKSVTEVAIMGAAGIAGAKLSDGIVAIMPESTSKYKKVIVAGLAFLGATAIDSKTTTGKAVQAALAGVVIKQGNDVLTESLTQSVDVKDNTTTSGRFLNAVIGHSAVVATAPAPGTAERFLASPTIDWVASAPAEPIHEPIVLGV